MTTPSDPQNQQSEKKDQGPKGKKRKQKRRAAGEGTVYRRKSDGRWVAELTLEDGRRKPFYGQTQEEAIAKRKQAEYEQMQGRLATGPKQKVKDFFTYWLEEVHRPPAIRISTYKAYRSLARNHILPALGHIQLQKLTTPQIQRLYSAKLKEGLSARTVIGMHNVLHKALDHAVRESLIARNVSDAVELPRKERYEIHPLTPNQAQRLIQAVREQRLEGVVTLAITTGMRKGEILALRWQDIDLEKGSIQLRRSVGYMSGYGFVEGEPKTKAGKRKIILPPFVIDMLKHHRAEQLEARLKAGAKWKEQGIVFCNMYGGFFNPTIIQRHFTKLLKKAGLPPMRFHDMRHSAATLLLSMGVNPKVVQELLGHSSITMTLDVYSHVLPSMQEDAMNKMNDLFDHPDGGENKGTN